MGLWRLLSVAALALVVAACGGGGGNPGACMGSAQVCGEAGLASAAGGGSSTGLGTTSFSRSGSGSASFELPATLTRVRVEASNSGSAASFVVRANGVIVIDEIVGGSTPSYDATFVVSGARNVEVVAAPGITWRFTEVRE